jgi:hypothetical protein
MSIDTTVPTTRRARHPFLPKDQAALPDADPMPRRKFRQNGERPLHRAGDVEDCRASMPKIVGIAHESSVSPSMQSD